MNAPVQRSEAQCAWAHYRCTEPTIERPLGQLPAYCYEHQTEVTWNRAAILTGVGIQTADVRKDETGDEALDEMYDPRIHYNLEAGTSAAKAHDKLAKFLRLSPKKQMEAGRAMRFSRTKGVAAELPTCSKCGAVRVLDPCRKCADVQEAKAYPAAVPA